MKMFNKVRDYLRIHPSVRAVGIVLSLVCSVMPVKAATGQTDKAPKTLPGGWKLEWNDEFTGKKLNEKKWRYEEGVVRNEGSSQAYTKECVKVEDGMLRITAEAKKTPNIMYKPDAANWPQNIENQDYASGSITTKGVKSFEAPGRLEFRARVPKAKGVWPAVWTMHENKYRWPANGEIDILEHISQEPNKVYSIFRWGENGTKKEHKDIYTTTFPNLSEEFHTYVLEWDEERMRILIDDKEVGAVDIAKADYPDGGNPLRTPCYLIINLAIGGPGTWPETPEAKDYPVTYEVDYVRYYTKKVKKKKNARQEKSHTKPSHHTHS